MSIMHRRTFLHATALAGAAALTGVHNSTRAAPVGASERIRVAVMGVRGRGKQHVEAFLKIPEVEVTHICDVDTSVVGPVVALIEKAQGKPPVVVQDIRNVLEDKTVQAISVATTNHWHALAGVWACQAGKDVYVEKPMSHNLVEGRRLVEAARKYGRMVQHGTQSRSDTDVQAAVDFIRAGKLGKVTLGRVWNCKVRGSIGKHTKDLPVPASVDYNLWVGPAPMKPIQRLRLHYDWHWFWDTGNGDVGNQAVHRIDVARRGLGITGLPRSVTTLGGRFGYQDDAETPNTVATLFDYGDVRLLCEVRNLKTEDLEGVRIGVVFHGTEGFITVPERGGTTAFLGKNRERVKLGTAARDFTPDHVRNFVTAMRSRKVEDLRADVNEGHISSALCHLANISYRLGQDVPFTASAPTGLTEQPELAEALRRTAEHVQANGVKLAETNYRLGRKLTIDAVNETCVGDREANALLTRAYRQPFVVPERV